MNSKYNKLLVFLGFITVSTASAQNFLTDYFKGNQDSLIAEAFRLINTNEPIFAPIDQSTGVGAQVLTDMGLEQVYPVEAHYFSTRDNKRIFTYKFPKPSPNTIILVHGVASSAYLYNKTAGFLQKATGAEVFAIDLRGHGQSDGNIGDVDYLDQYVDDLNDIVGTIHKGKPNGKIIIAGHSMGGGVALRYAMKKKYLQPDGFLLFAPLIGHNSPAISQPENTAQDDGKELFMKIHIERIIGLKMLNEIGKHDYDSLPVLFFNFPEMVPLRKYSYRANVSMAPDDYKTGLKSVDKPMLVLIGSEDEAFSSETLQKAVFENSTAEVHVIEGATHNGIRHNTVSFSFIENWFSKL